MSLDPFNSVGGFSVGVPAVQIIDGQGTFVSGIFSPTGNVLANNIFSNNYVTINNMTAKYFINLIITVAELIDPSDLPGARCIVSDATTTTFASVVVGGGSNTVPVYSDGTDWRIG